MRKFLIPVLLLIIIIIIPTSVYGQEQDVSILEEERGSLQREVVELEAKIKEYEERLGEKHTEVTSLKNQIYIINTRINRLDAQIQKTRNLINVAKLNIQETQEEIDSAITSIEKDKATLAELLRNFYALDNESMIERLLKYSTLSEGLGRVQNLKELQEKIYQVLGETRESKRRLEVHEADLKGEKLTLEEQNRQLAFQKEGQRSERAHKNTILEKTEEEEEKYQKLLSKAESERAEYMKKITLVEQQILIQENFISYFKAGEIPEPGTKIFIWPEDNPRLTQGYGMTPYALRGAYGGKGHNGIDLAHGIGTPIKAAAGGKVVAKGEESCQDYGVRSCNGYWGNWVAIEHPGGLVSLYSHMTKPSHKGMGEDVQGGEIIGYEGATGNITGPHLHFSVYTEFFTYKDPSTGITRFSYNYDKTINPLDYL